MIVFILTLTYVILMIVVPKTRLGLFNLKYMDYQPLNWFVFGLALGFSVVIYMNQKLIQ